MMQKKYLISFIFSYFTIFGAIAQEGLLHTGNHDLAFAGFRKLSARQLLDTADYYTKNHYPDTALMCYNLIINAFSENSEIEQKERTADALNRSALVYYYMCDYREAYKFLIDALLLCEKINYTACEVAIYSNIGSIYYRFNKFDLAKQYFTKALNLSQDTTIRMILLNNLSSVELQNDNLDSAFHLISKAMKIKPFTDPQKNKIAYLWNNLASLFLKQKSYDSAYFYYQLSSYEALKNNEPEINAYNLSDLGKMFLEKNQMDSAQRYIYLSNELAEEHHYLNILTDNYLLLSNIEEQKGNQTNTLDYFKRYAKMRDSAFGIDKFMEINQLQQSYNAAKTNEILRQLSIKQQIRERAIFYQRIILAVLILICAILLFAFFQKRRLNRAYKVLVEKNLEIVDFKKKISEKSPEKYKKSALTDDMQNELLNKIMAVMENTAIICDTKFSIDKLAELVQSNHSYVSQVINQSLEKNFRSFLNGYRIREAQRLFAEPDATKYTIEYVALQVGFKSRNAFNDTFKEITGISPNFYLRNMQQQQQ